MVMCAPRRCYPVLINNNHLKEVVKGASSSFMVKAASAAVSLIFYMYLGRVLGADGAGVFFLTLTVLTIASVVGRFGLENTLLKLVSKGISINEWGIVYDAYVKSFRLVIIVSILISACIYIGSNYLSMLLFSTDENALLIELAAISVTPLALSVLNAQAIQGLKEIFYSSIILNLLIPLIALSTAIMIAGNYGVLGVVSSYVFAIFIVFFISLLLWFYLIKDQVRDSGKVTNEEIYTSCVPLFWVSLLQMIINWFPYMVLGTSANEADVGVFGVCVRVITLFGFFLMALNSITAPKIAAMYKKQSIDEIELMCRSSSTLLLYATLPLFFATYFGAEYILTLFGREFAGNSLILRVLMLGQFINIFMGSVGVLLAMTGNEKSMRNNLVFTATLCVVLNLVLVPLYGLLGAAISFSLSMGVQNLSMAYKAKSVINIITIPYLNPTRVIKGAKE